MPPRLVLGALALLVCFAAAGCAGAPVPTPFAVEYPAATDSVQAVPISLIDQTGLVTGITLAPEVPAAEGVSAVADQPNLLRVAWPGGRCDDRATLVMNRIGSGYELAIHNHPRITAGIQCDASAVTRAIDITFMHPLDATQLSLNVTYP